MKKKFLIHKLVLALPILIFMAVYMAWFGAVEKADFAGCTEIHTFLDDKIPFCEYFIIPYLLWFGYVAVGVVYQLFADEKAFKELCGVLMSGMFVFLIVSTMFPNILFLRPEEMPRDNVFCHMVEGLYKTDTPTNVMPSIHVFNTLAVLFSVFRSQGKLAGNLWVRTGCVILSVSIILATMFLKQHSVLDVTGAIIMFTVFQTVFAKIFEPESSERKALATA
ncbi:MAG: phosphatase PAP2 family protein [Ruminococcus sp.]|nr:phosphatase PAP2 family protein [Ruminococcus sp.]